MRSFHTLTLFPCINSLSVVHSAQAWEGDVFVKRPIKYNNLKFIEVWDVNFIEMNEVLYVHHLLLQSPYLQELHISVSSISP